MPVFDIVGDMATPPSCQLSAKILENSKEFGSTAGGYSTGTFALVRKRITILANVTFKSPVMARTLAIHQFSRAAQRGGSGRQDRTILTMRRRPLVNQEVRLRATFLG